MKTRSLILGVLSTFLVCFPSFAEKRAYLICIGEYAKGTEWGKISADNDLQLLKNVLSDEFTVATISNSEATYHNVVTFLNGIANNADPGDTIVIHFSCHGQQMITVNDKTEPDGLDEAIITYDANKYYTSAYHGEHHLRDDEIDKIFDRIRRKLGDKGFLFVLFDACHSDTLYKGQNGSKVNGQILRGTGEIFGPETTKVVIDSLRKIKYAQEPFHINKDTGTCNVVYVSACQAASKNAETVVGGIGYGSLSFAFVQAYKSECGIKKDNLNELLSSIRDNMYIIHGSQVPTFHSSLPIKLRPVTKTNITTNQRQHILRKALLSFLILFIITICATCIARIMRNNRLE